MKFEQGGNGKEKAKRAGTHIGAFLAGALAMHAVTGGDEQKSAEFAPLQSNVTDSYTPELSYESSNYESFEFPASADAVSAVDLLNAELGPKIEVPLEYLRQIRENIRVYVDAHPLIEGKVITSPSGTDSYQSASYDPYSDLLFATLKNPQINPALQGVLQKELNEARLIAKGLNQGLKPSVE